MKNITKMVLCVAIFAIGVLGLTLSLPFDAAPSIPGLIIALLLMVIGVFGLMYFIIRILLVKKRP